MNSINEGNQMLPIMKAPKRILDGSEDSIKSFCDMAFLIAGGKFPANKGHRAVDAEPASGQNFANVLYRVT